MDIARYAELFRTESRDHLARIDAELIALGSVLEAVPSGEAPTGATAASARARVDALFRSMHTIKGMAGAMGYAVVEQLAHDAEQQLDTARGDVAHVTTAFAARLQRTADALAQQVEDAVEGRAPSPLPAPLTPPSFPTVSRSTPEDTRSAAVERAATGAPLRTRLVTVELSTDTPLKSVRAQVVLVRLETLGRVHSTEPPVSSITDRFAGALQVLVESSASDDALVAAVCTAGDIASVTVQDRQLRSAAREVVRQVRVDADRLDALLDLVGELVIGRDRLLRATEQSTDSAVREGVRTVAGLIRTLQEEILQTRMVPASHVLDRFPRLVRDVARDVGKEVVFAMEGRELAVDRAMLDAIVDPIIHLLRNAIDHGIEDARTRAALGKPAVGRLVLRAVRDRSAVVVTVEDDGRGIDRARVYARAVADGHWAAGADAPTDEELMALLAVPGFSTAERVTSVSGRGVGIDVVASRVRALGGTLSLTSVPGRGTVVSLRLPVALSILPAMLVRVGEGRYAIPSAHVVEVLEGAAIAPLTADPRCSGPTAIIRGEILPYLRLRTVFGEAGVAASEPQWLVVEVAGRRLVCEVDALLGQQDVVMKPFAAVRGLPARFAGATILGDGCPALIVDIGGLA